MWPSAQEPQNRRRGGRREAERGTESSLEAHGLRDADPLTKQRPGLKARRAETTVHSGATGRWGLSLAGRRRPCKARTGAADGTVRTAGRPSYRARVCAAPQVLRDTGAPRGPGRPSVSCPRKCPPRSWEPGAGEQLGPSRRLTSATGTSASASCANRSFLCSQDSSRRPRAMSSSTETSVLAFLEVGSAGVSVRVATGVSGGGGARGARTSSAGQGPRPCGR